MPPKKFFDENGLTVMFEASDFDKVDQISYFLRFVVDVLCGNKDKDETTATSTLYGDLAAFFQASISVILGQRNYI